MVLISPQSGTFLHRGYTVAAPWLHRGITGAYHFPLIFEIRLPLTAYRKKPSGAAQLCPYCNWKKNGGLPPRRKR